ncbi:putative C-type lectin domain family 20 member A [Dasypus novemcinctus]|uniref:putative C-type lectin domain family 20 member A n=1 Tax=Dasypus novemcinctus TaxID=9361 RepID=UPI00265E57AE|nr:putative C-type lectin domain family 20 member A [Dasypus novemcinctus]
MLLRTLLLSLCAAALKVEGSGKTFERVEEARSWPDALEHCRRLHTDLADLQSLYSLTAVKTIYSIMSSTEAWVGLYFNTETLDLSWSSGSTFTGLQWSPAPALEAGLCATLYTQYAVPRLGAASCSAQKHFICYYDPTVGHRISTEPLPRTTPTPQTAVVQIGQQTFLRYERVMTWSGALLYCRGHHTDLADLQNVTDEEGKKALKSITSEIEAWVGLYFNAGSRSLSWSSDLGTSIPNWLQVPTFDTGLCAGLRTYARFDPRIYSVVCSSLQPFICFYDPAIGHRTSAEFPMLFLTPSSEVTMRVDPSHCGQPAPGPRATRPRAAEGSRALLLVLAGTGGHSQARKGCGSLPPPRVPQRPRPESWALGRGSGRGDPMETSSAALGTSASPAGASQGLTSAVRLPQRVTPEPAEPAADTRGSRAPSPSADAASPGSASGPALGPRPSPLPAQSASPGPAPPGSPSASQQVPGSALALTLSLAAGPESPASPIPERWLETPREAVASLGSTRGASAHPGSVTSSRPGGSEAAGSSLGAEESAFAPPGPGSRTVLSRTTAPPAPAAPSPASARETAGNRAETAVTSRSSTDIRDTAAATQAHLLSSSNHLESQEKTTASESGQPFGILKADFNIPSLRNPEDMKDEFLREIQEILKLILGHEQFRLKWVGFEVDKK